MILDHRGNPVKKQPPADTKRRMDQIRADTRRDRDYILGSTAYYEAAQLATKERPEHWSRADTLSSKAANSAEVRKILRNRVRYEVANNSYAEGIVQTDADFIIGQGPRVHFRVDTDDETTKDEARRAEKLFMRWARHRKINLPRLLHTAWRCRLQDGEPFIRLNTGNDSVMGISLMPELIECDRIASPVDYKISEQHVDGIILDNGKPKEYILLKEHPGDEFNPHAYADQDMIQERIPADQMIHWFKQTRPEQYRGIPELAPALALFEHLRRLTLAILAAAETAADISLYLKTTMPAGNQADETVLPLDTYPMERGMIMTLPEGWEPHQVQGTQPNQEYGRFKREIVTEMARVLSMPYNIAACDSSDYNYASGRLDHQTYFNRINIQERDAEIQVVEPIVEAWLQEAILYHGLQLDPDEIDIQAFWTGMRHVDPLKEANANRVMLETGQKTLDMIYAENGLDIASAFEHGAQTMGLSERGYKSLVTRKIFEGAFVENGQSNPARARARLLQEANAIIADYEDIIGEERLDEIRDQVSEGRMNMIDMLEALDEQARENGVSNNGKK